ncbi:hypothetical protein GCM10010275_18090 [Streptomyces litmocidini]|nr:hypothetical protein GCM10010275_18090 [Streptomyces litmocidini]
MHENLPAGAPLSRTRRHAVAHKTSLPLSPERRRGAGRGGGVGERVAADQEAGEDESARLPTDVRRMSGPAVLDAFRRTAPATASSVAGAIRPPGRPRPLGPAP